MNRKCFGITVLVFGLMGCGSDSGERGVAINPNVQLVAPASVSGHARVSQSRIVLQWEQNATNEINVSIVVQRRLSSESDFTDLAVLAEDVNSYDDQNNLVANAVYVYRIKVIGDAINAHPAYSNEVTVTYSNTGTGDGDNTT
ncbi:MAG: hypothetical protein KDD48_04970 [Bdellovibrionales bacterium]|nr:hypothetical protein [Bdellovibrionales bacterium]